MKQKTKITFFKYLQFLFRVGLFGSMFYSFFLAGGFYNQYHNDGESIYTFFTTEREISIDIYERETLINLDKNSIPEYNYILDQIKIAVMFLFFYMVSDYFIDPERHFITTIIKWFKKLNLPVED